MSYTHRSGSTQDERFYFLFEQLADKATLAAKRFQRLMEDFNGLQEAVADIRLLEHEADALVHELESRLNFARVTPLDREDIHALTGRLDDIVDHVEATADRLALFRVTEPTEHLRKLADALVRGSEEVKISVRLLAQGEREQLWEHCRQINEIENEADQILRDALFHLFSGDENPLEVVKWKEIYEFVECAVDSCEDVADVIETAAIKKE